MLDFVSSTTDTARSLGYFDLPVIVGFSVLVGLWALLGDPPTGALVAFGTAYLFFIPGYTLTLIAFPQTVDVSESSGVPGRGIDRLERYALAIGLSLTLLPIVGMGLAATPIGISPTTGIAVLAGGSVIGALGGMSRRRSVNLEDRFYPDIPHVLTGNRASIAVNVTLVLSVVIAVTVLGFAIAFPQSGEQTTELYLLADDGEGEPVASGYPDTIAAGESITIEIGVENHEGEPVEYTLVTAVERLDEDGTVAEQDTLHEQEIRLIDGEQWRSSVDIAPTMRGEDLRISVLLYRGEPHFFLDQRTAYRHTHIRVDVLD